MPRKQNPGSGPTLDEFLAEEGQLAEAEDAEDFRAAKAAKAEIARGEDEVIPWKRARKEMAEREDE